MLSSRLMVRGGLLIALALAFQSLRLVVPVPQPFSTFLIGTLVHMMLTLTLKLTGLAPAAVLCFLLPLTAYLQGQLLIPLLIPVVWLGNLLFVLLLQMQTGNRLMATLVPALGKAVVMLGAAWCVLTFLQINNPAIRKAILFAMSVPQLVTAMLGIYIARKVFIYLRKI